MNPESDQRYRDYWQTYHRLTERHGVSPDLARTVLRTDATAIAAVAVHRGDADAMICGATGGYREHMKVVEAVIGRAPGVRRLSENSLIILQIGRAHVRTPDTNENIGYRI